MQDRVEIYDIIKGMRFPDEYDIEDVPTAIADISMLNTVLSYKRYERDVNSLSGVILAITHAAMDAMMRFGVAWRVAEGIPLPHGEAVFLPEGNNGDWQRTVMAVDLERKYQDHLPRSRCFGASGEGGNSIEQNPLSVGATNVLLSRYIRHAEDAWSDKPGDDAALDIMRKIAAIGLRHLETHGLTYNPNDTQDETSCGCEGECDGESPADSGGSEEV